MAVGNQPNLCRKEGGGACKNFGLDQTLGPKRRSANEQGKK